MELSQLNDEREFNYLLINIIFRIESMNLKRLKIKCKNANAKFRSYANFSILAILWNVVCSILNFVVKSPSGNKMFRLVKMKSATKVNISKAQDNLYLWLLARVTMLYKICLDWWWETRTLLHANHTDRFDNVHCSLQLSDD